MTDAFSHRTPVIRFAPGLRERMLASVGALPPEHCAVLGGYLDDPLRITDLQPMAPLADAHGNFRHSSAAVTLDGPRIEYYANTCLYPFGKYILGIMHSHPGNMTCLSDGASGSGQGDIPSMRAHLQAAARMGDPWHNFIAPIVTKPGSNPQIKSWIVRLDSARPIPAETVWEKTADIGQPELPELPLPPLNDEIIDLLLARPDLVHEIIRRRDRLKAMSTLRSHHPRQNRDARILMKLLQRHRGR